MRELDHAPPLLPGMSETVFGPLLHVLIEALSQLPFDSAVSNWL
jgi:hypothetical protein